MRAAEFIVQRLADSGLDTCFSVTGGGAMFLNDAFAGEARFKTYYLHHEQACAMAAEGFAKVKNRAAVVNVTAGPGAINALNGVFGAFTDSVPMIVISGQARRETLNNVQKIPALRQLGDQEVDIIAMVTPITKARFLLTDPADAAAVVDEAVAIATSGRPGPVWIDVPVDVQGTNVEAASYPPLKPRDSVRPASVSQERLEEARKLLAAAKRPVIIAGTGVRVSGMTAEFLELVETLGVPVVTAWTHDLIDSSHPLFVGRPGSIGTRAGNFVVQNADLILVLGSRLNIRQVSFNWTAFAKNAKKVWVDIDEAEFRKPFYKIDLAIAADLASFIPEFQAHVKKASWKPDYAAWLAWCRDIRQRHEPRESDYPARPGSINAYHFIMDLFRCLKEDDIIACGDATACIVPYQCGPLHGSQRMFSNSGSASMGYDLPAAIGAAVAAPDQRIICLAGDGSIMMNIQELQSIRYLQKNVKVFVLDNGGYLSIKQGQKNYFGRESGCSPESGLSLPDFERVAVGFNLPAKTLSVDHWKAELRAFLDTDGPAVCVVPLDRAQEFEPRLKSRLVDGVLQTPELDDMHPFLPEAELQRIRESALAIK